MSEPAFTERRRRFRERMEEARKHLLHVNDPAARAVLAALIDELEELLKV